MRIINNIKKLVIANIILLVVLGLAACRSKEVDNLEWTNSNAVYAFIKAGYEHEVLSDVENAFRTLHFKKIYVTEKHVNAYTPLVLLFVLDENRSEEAQTFIDILNEDVRINHAIISRDLYFETVDTRSIEKAKDTILVGETLELEMKGSVDFYVKPFGDEGLLIKPVDDKAYTIRDFPQINLKSVESRDNGWLYLELANSGYFEVIKTANTLSRLLTIEKVELDKHVSITFPPAIWEISDTEIAIFESTAGGGYPTATIKGISAGVVTITFGDMSCEITIISNE